MCVCVCVFLGAWQHGNSINFHLCSVWGKTRCHCNFRLSHRKMNAKASENRRKKEKEHLVFHTHTEKVRSKKDNKKLIATNSCTISRVRLETRVEGPRQKWVLKGDQTPHGTRVPSFFDSFQRLAFFATPSVFLLIFGPAMWLCLPFSCLILALFHSFTPQQPPRFTAQLSILVLFHFSRTWTFPTLLYTRALVRGILWA